MIEQPQNPTLPIHGVMPRFSSVLSLFDGMSCGQIALNKAGIEYDNYFASEIDKHAIKVTQTNYPNTIQLGDVREIKAENLPKIDLLIGGSPCQDLSKSHKADGLKGSQSILYYEFLRLKNELNPKYWLLENIDSYKTNPIDLDLGNHYKINSDRFLPQNRIRRYWTNIPIKDLPNRPDWNFEYGQQVRRDVNGIRPMKNGTAPTLLKAMGAGGGNMPCIKDNGDWRILTINEIELLQGVPFNYTDSVSLSQRKMMIGNGWTVDVIAHIFGSLLNGA